MLEVVVFLVSITSFFTQFIEHGECKVCLASGLNVLAVVRKFE